MPIKLKCGWCAKEVTRSPSATKPRGNRDYIAYCGHKCRIAARHAQGMVAVREIAAAKRIVLKQPHAYRLIALGNTHVTMVDIEDYNWLNSFNWRESDQGYAKRDGKPKIMHRAVIERVIGRSLKRDEHVDHIDTNRLNNRRSNLRVATNHQNRYNQKPRANGTSKYKGVYWATREGCWSAAICADNRKYRLGRFNDETEAALAYDAAAIQLQGEFAWLNMIGR